MLVSAKCAVCYAKMRPPPDRQNHACFSGNRLCRDTPISGKAQRLAWNENLRYLCGEPLLTSLRYLCWWPWGTFEQSPLLLFYSESPWRRKNVTCSISMTPTTSWLTLVDVAIDIPNFGLDWAHCQNYYSSKLSFNQFISINQQVSTNEPTGYHCFPSHRQPPRAPVEPIPTTCHTSTGLAQVRGSGGSTSSTRVFRRIGRRNRWGAPAGLQGGEVTWLGCWPIAIDYLANY